MITNTTTGALDNDHDEFSLSISDTNSHDLPDTDGDDSAGGDYWDGRTADAVVAYVENNQDQSLTATLKRRPDPDSSVEIADVESVSVASAGTEALIATETAPMGQFRVEVSFDSAPSGSNDTVVLFDWRHRR
jgi:hypothetical protein